jgi:hypothetical protein
VIGPTKYTGATFTTNTANDYNISIISKNVGAPTFNQTNVPFTLSGNFGASSGGAYIFFGIAINSSYQGSTQIQSAINTIGTYSTNGTLASITNNATIEIYWGSNVAGVSATVNNVTMTLGNNALLTFPVITTNDTVVGQTTTDTLTNKSLQGITTFFIDNTDPTKKMKFDLTNITTGTTRTSTMPDSNIILIGSASNITITGIIVSQNSNVVTSIKSEFNKNVAPTINDDNTTGYSVGSRWIDTTLGDEYVNVDATTGAAVWKKTTP